MGHHTQTQTKLRPLPERVLFRRSLYDEALPVTAVFHAVSAGDDPGRVVTYTQEYGYDSHLLDHILSCTRPAMRREYAALARHLKATGRPITVCEEVSFWDRKRLAEQTKR